MDDRGDRGDTAEKLVHFGHIYTREIQRGKKYKIYFGS